MADRDQGANPGWAPVDRDYSRQDPNLDLSDRECWAKVFQDPTLRAGFDVVIAHVRANGLSGVKWGQTQESFQDEKAKYFWQNVFLKGEMLQSLAESDVPAQVLENWDDALLTVHEVLELVNSGKHVQVFPNGAWDAWEKRPHKSYKKADYGKYYTYGSWYREPLNQWSQDYGYFYYCSKYGSRWWSWKSKRNWRWESASQHSWSTNRSEDWTSRPSGQSSSRSSNASSASRRR